MFTIRVYGLLLHQGHVLVSDELIQGRRVTKFPGGGLEYGEGLKDGLLRELREEMGVEAFALEHFYTTDFFQQSSFHTRPMQVLSVYYTFCVARPEALPVVQEPFAGLAGPQDDEVCRWLPLAAPHHGTPTLPIDKVVWDMLRR